MEQQAAAKPAPAPARSKDDDERKRAKEALERAREHVQRLKKSFDKD
jgi:hypothetical protein